MITLTDVQWNALLSWFIWPFVRILGLVATDPVIGVRTVPAPVKIGFAIALTIIILPTLPPPGNIAPGSAAGLLILVQQLLIGISMGFAMRICFSIIELAGQLSGQQMGLGFAMFFDPQRGAQVAVISQFMGVLGVLVYLSMDAHLLLITTLSDSFRILPINGTLLRAAGFHQLVQWGGAIFQYGLLLSMPVVASLLIVNLAIGVMTRAAPQFNIFAIGFPITLAIGFIVVYVSLPFWVPALDELFNQTFVELAGILHAFASGKS